MYTAALVFFVKPVLTAV